MKIRFPLYAKILVWFFGNILLIVALLYALFRFQFHMDLNSLLAGRAGDRIAAVAEAIRGELNASAQQKKQGSWDAVLERFSKAYGIRFALFWDDASRAAGGELDLPAIVRARLPMPRPPFHIGARPPGMEEPGAPGSYKFFPPPSGHPSRLHLPLGSPPGSKMVLHTDDPSRYWILVRFPLHDADGTPRLLTLVAVSSSLNVGGLFFDYALVFSAAAGALALSALFWIPLVRSITRAISQMTRATARIAEGEFDVRVDEKRRDELGMLGQGVNQMASRLAGLVCGQRRFLGDVAHELCSPLARTQMALGILEQRAGENQLPYLADLREEVQTMSNLVNELLSFSKASLGGVKIKLTSVALRPLIEKAIFQEAYSEATIDLSVSEKLYVLAGYDMLLRSVGNLIRNAIRYAGSAGPICVSATRSIGQVVLTVADSGPGIPEASLPHVFDPFYRADPSRDRETGGIGLGLSIVKTCIESCGGTVSCRNRAPHGLEVTVILKIASAPDGEVDQAETAVNAS